MPDRHPAASPESDLDAEALALFVRQDRHGPPGAELRAWLLGDPVRQAAYRRWQQDWLRLDHLPDTALQALRHGLAADQAAETKTQARRRGWLRWPGLPQVTLAGALVFGVAGATLGWHLWHQPVFEQRFATGRGGQLDVYLPDGSHLRLDTATRVDVALYRHRRVVRLPEGQVAFEVHGDAGRPFDVLAGMSRVTVTGTRFSVRHTPGIVGAEGVRVAVEQGRVQVSRVPLQGDGDTALLQLGAGQQSVADAGGRPAPATPVAPSGIAPWRDGRISFQDLPLAQALAELERYGPTHLRVHDPAVAALRISGTFDPLRPGNFRQALPKVLPVRLKDEGDSVEIQAAPR